jgi:multiple sugar transport system ATP-binding protein
MARVQLDRISKTFEKGRAAVAQATFEVADSELLVLVGPSGCGKSTLLRIIAGLESPTSGTVRIDDRIVNDIAPKDRDVAMVFQSYALYPHMSVAENLGFSLKLQGRPRAEVDRRVRESAELLGIADLLERQPKQLSGGQRQRVALGRALVRRPKVFLLDEPLSNLDAKLRMAMRAEIARLHRRLAVTTIYVTHDQIEAMTLGQRIVVLKDGEIQQIDSPLRVYRRPANVFVAGFLGSPSMNFLRGCLVQRDGWRLALEPAHVPLGELRVEHSALAQFRDAQVIVGVRPEDLRLAGPPGSVPHEPRIDAQLELIEPVGNEVFVSTRFGHTELVLRMPPSALSDPGGQVSLTFAPDSLHFFDPATGRRIECAS